jgi:hypothetical protein
MYTSLSSAALAVTVTEARRAEGDGRRARRGVV